MRRLLLILISGLWLSACATSPAIIETIDVTESIRPVQQETDTSLETSLALQNAQLDYKAERYDKSFDTFQLVALKEPENIEAHIGWGNSAIALNLFEKAHEIFSNETGLDNATPSQKSAYLAGLVLSEVGTGRAEDEEVRLNAALEYNLHDTRLWNALGRYHDTHGQWIQAQRTYLKALNTGEHAQPSVVNNQGMSLLKQGLFDAALEKFVLAIEIKPARQLYDNNRRMTLALMADFDAATENAPPDRIADILNDAGYFALSQKKTSIAQNLLERSIELSASFNPEAMENLDQLKAQLEALSISSGDKNDETAINDTPTDWGKLLP